MLKQRKGQVWIETVTYTLIAFVLIGLVLGFAKPKIEEIQDQSIIEQSIKIMKELDYIVSEISEKGTGNKRKVELTIKKGELEFIPINNTIIFTINGKFMYSQPDQKYKEGGLSILTKEVGKEFHVTIEKKFEDINMTYNEKLENKKILKASTPYTLYVTNKGGVDQVIDFQID